MSTPTAPRRDVARRIIDISPRVSPRIEVWPGDTPFSSHRVMDLADGCSCNVTTITTTVHVGAHADAPLHFQEGGADAASVDLAPYLGTARVVRMQRRGAISRADIEALDLQGVERLLLSTRRLTGRVRFADGFAHLEPDAAQAIAEARLKLFGIDTWSVDHPDSKTLESHHALLRGGCLILEGLLLDGISPGDYELIALPLRLEGCDASPVRAVLRELPQGGARRGLPRRTRARDPHPPGEAEGPDGVTMEAFTGEAMSEKDCLLSTVDLRPGDTVRVTLDSPANVMLIDPDDLDRYARGLPYAYHGGWATESPVILEAPGAGRWHVVVDLGGGQGAVQASVKVVQ